MLSGVHQAGALPGTWWPQVGDSSALLGGMIAGEDGDNEVAFEELMEDLTPGKAAAARRSARSSAGARGPRTRKAGGAAGGIGKPRAKTLGEVLCERGEDRIEGR